MNQLPQPPDLSGRRVLVPGGTGTVGEGVVRQFLKAGATVLVPTRTQQRADEFGHKLAGPVGDRLHLVVHDYTTFAGAEGLVAEMVTRLGGIDDVVAPIGGWWAGGPLAGIDEADWTDAFVGLATAHMAVARASLPRMTSAGAYSVVVGDSSSWPVPGSGLVSMEQAAVLMMRRVLAAELQEARRVFALVLGPVSAGPAGSDDQDTFSADDVGAVAVAASSSVAPGRDVPLHHQTEVDEALALFGAPHRNRTEVPA